MLIHGEGDLYGRRYQLLPWHREFLWRWYELDPSPEPDLHWWYDEALVGRERGAVKTEFFGGLALLEFAGPMKFRRRTPIIEVAAASYDQTGELFRQVQIMAGGHNDAPVSASPLCGMLDVFDGEVQYKDGRPGMIRRRAAIAGTSEGGKPTLFLGDELHEWTGNKERVYTVHSAGLSKGMRGGRACLMSTAAAGRGSIPPADTDPLLWRLYARGLLEQNDPTSRFLFDWCEASPHWDLDDPEQLRAALREMTCADITWRVERRARDMETRKVPRHEGERYYLNRFVAMKRDSWLREIPGVWEDNADEHAVPADGSEVVVGVDMALWQDSVGVVVAGRLSDGRVGWWTHAWPPVNGRIDHLAVFGEIAGMIAQRWKIRAVTYDPRYFEVPARLLEDQGIKVIQFNQSPERLVPADQLLYDLTVAHELVHLDDVTLNEHANNAVFRVTERGRYFAKSLSGGHMDLIRAGSMATWELLQPGPSGPASASAKPSSTGSIFRPTGRLNL